MDGGVGRDVELDHFEGQLGFGGRLAQRLRFAEISHRGEHAIAVTREMQGGGEADAGARARNDGDFHLDLLGGALSSRA